MDNSNNANEAGHEAVIVAVEKLFKVKSYRGYDFKSINAVDKWIIEYVDDYDDKYEDYDDYSKIRLLHILLKAILKNLSL